MEFISQSNYEKKKLVEQEKFKKTEPKTDTSKLV